jgi:hypothetical protein
LLSSDFTVGQARGLPHKFTACGQWLKTLRHYARLHAVDTSRKRMQDGVLILSKCMPDGLRYLLRLLRS